MAGIFPAAAGQRGDLMVLEDEQGMALEGGVRLGLPKIDRHVPAGLPRPHDLVVPVSALDEPHGERKPLFRGPSR